MKGFTFSFSKSIEASSISFFLFKASSINEKFGYKKTFFSGESQPVWPDGQMVCSILAICNSKYLPIRIKSSQSGLKIVLNKRWRLSNFFKRWCQSYFSRSFLGRITLPTTGTGVSRPMAKKKVFARIKRPLSFFLFSIFPSISQINDKMWNQLNFENEHRWTGRESNPGP